MKRFVQRPGAAIVFAWLGLFSTALFLRRAAAAIPLDLPAGEVALYSALYTTVIIATLRLSKWSEPRSGAMTARVGGLLFSLAFVAGLSSQPIATITGVIAVGAVLAVSSLPIPLPDGVAQAVDLPAASFPNRQPAMPELQECDGSKTGDSGTWQNSISLLRNRVGESEQIAGSIAVEFDAREVVRTLHVPLWPPLPAEPVIECHLDGLDGRIRVPLVKRHGFRIEVRLPEECDEPLVGTLRFTATASCRSAAA